MNTPENNDKYNTNCADDFIKKDYRHIYSQIDEVIRRGKVYGRLSGPGGVMFNVVDRNDLTFLNVRAVPSATGATANFAPSMTSNDSIIEELQNFNLSIMFGNARNAKTSQSVVERVTASALQDYVNKGYIVSTWSTPSGEPYQSDSYYLFKEPQSTNDRYPSKSLAVPACGVELVYNGHVGVECYNDFKPSTKPFAKCQVLAPRRSDSKEYSNEVIRKLAADCVGDDIEASVTSYIYAMAVADNVPSKPTASVKVGMTIDSRTGKLNSFNRRSANFSQRREMLDRANACQLGLSYEQYLLNLTGQDSQPPQQPMSMQHQQSMPPQQSMQHQQSMQTMPMQTQQNMLSMSSMQPMPHQPMSSMQTQMPHQQSMTPQLQPMSSMQTQQPMQTQQNMSHQSNQQRFATQGMYTQQDPYAYQQNPVIHSSM